MRITIPGLIKSLSLSVVILATFAAGHSVAKADEVLISGYTNACFGVCDPVTSSASQATTLLGLTYQNSNFSGLTANGFLAFGGNPLPVGTQNVNNFGSFTLSSVPASYDGNTFRLRITFTAPQGLSSSTNVFTADVIGTVRSDTDGGVRIDFDQTVNQTGILFTFNDLNCEPSPFQPPPGQQVTCGTGSFRLRLNDVSINPGQIASLTGDIISAQQTAIPEPATLVLLGTGLSGIAAIGRRRRKRS